MVGGEKAWYTSTVYNLHEKHFHIMAGVFDRPQPEWTGPPKRKLWQFFPYEIPPDATEGLPKFLTPGLGS